MTLLDTDHLTVLSFPESRDAQTLISRMSHEEDDAFVASIVSAEEQFRGWLAYINRMTSPRRQTVAYARLGALIEFFSNWEVLAFDDLAAIEFDRLRRGKVRIGSMDLKIAAIALVNDCRLLSANLRDFNQVPGLQVESWI
jgi:tRNA(fMet)-specific endonuclease VapC